ncbi:hypothetical protein JCM33774_74250 [Actinophytocola sp. KF-1]
MLGEPHEGGETRQYRHIAERCDGERRAGEDRPPPAVLEGGHTVRNVITPWAVSYLGDKCAEDDAKGKHDDESAHGEGIAAQQVGWHRVLLVRHTNKPRPDHARRHWRHHPSWG